MTSAVQLLLNFLRAREGNLSTKNPLTLIPTFNNPTYLTRMLAQLKARALSNYLILDGGSTFFPMQMLLEALTKENRVIALNQNPGPTFFYEDKRFFGALPKLFVVTDPDLDLNPRMPSDFLLTLLHLSEELKIGKVALSLSIADELPIRGDLQLIGGHWHTIRGWESRFWSERLPNSLGLPVYGADTDTTFALYNKDFFKRSRPLRSVRIAGDFAAIHLPWLEDSLVPENERDYYARTQGNGEFRQLDAMHHELQARIDAINRSLSWRITRPLRWMKNTYVTIQNRIFG